MTVAPLHQAVLTAAAAKSSGSGSFTFIIFLVVIGLVGYFLLLRPQQQKARRQRETQSEIGVGDEVLTVGGIVGTVIEIDSERVTIVTGVDPAEQGGAQPARMLLVRSAIARKIEPTVTPGSDAPTANGRGSTDTGGDVHEGDDQDRTNGGPKEGGDQ